MLVTLWTLPWELLRGVFAGVGCRLAWVPLGAFAWRTRFVVGSVAIVLETQAGGWPSPIVIAVFLALSYLTPRWRHAWHRHLCQVADRHAAELGLTEPLAWFLRRLPARPPSRAPRPPHRHGAASGHPLAAGGIGPSPSWPTLDTPVPRAGVGSACRRRLKMRP